MTDYPVRLSNFQFRKAEGKGDEKLLNDVQTYGWHVVAVPDDAEGPGFAFTVGLFLRTLQPEILLMGVNAAPAMRVLNAIGEFLIAGGELTPETKYSDFVDGREVIFRVIHSKNYRDYLGCAIWFYRPLSSGFPALQCIWPDNNGLFPHERGCDSYCRERQIDLSI